MKNILTSGWNVMRVLRLVLGLAIVMVAILQHDKLLGIAGGLLAVLSVFNAGCGSGGCVTPGRSRHIAANPKEKETI